MKSCYHTHVLLSTSKQLTLSVSLNKSQGEGWELSKVCGLYFIFQHFGGKLCFGFFLLAKFLFRVRALCVSMGMISTLYYEPASLSWFTTHPADGVVVFSFTSHTFLCKQNSIIWVWKLGLPHWIGVLMQRKFSEVWWCRIYWQVSLLAASTSACQPLQTHELFTAQNIYWQALGQEYLNRVRVRPWGSWITLCLFCRHSSRASWRSLGTWAWPWSSSPCSSNRARPSCRVVDVTSTLLHQENHHAHQTTRRHHNTALAAVFNFFLTATHTVPLVQQGSMLRSYLSWRMWEAWRDGSKVLPSLCPTWPLQHMTRYLCRSNLLDTLKVWLFLSVLSSAWICEVFVHMIMSMSCERHRYDCVCGRWYIFVQSF